MFQANPRRPLMGLMSLLLALAVAACGVAQGEAPSPTAAASTTPAAGAAPANASRLNLNTATEADFLAAIPGLGNRMVREFMEYRPYVSIQEFRREMGKYVDDAQVAEYEKYVYVPIAVNDSDAETLQQIPGLDASEVADLMAGRPYALDDAFLTRLADYVSADELAIARTTLSNP